MSSSSHIPPTRFIGLTLYELLNISTTATVDEIKKAYRRAALKYHPDHNHSIEANEEFSYLARAHDILSNPSTREQYDRYGDSNEIENDHIIDEDAISYWRSIFPKVTSADIEAFQQKYVGSEEELEDIKDAYQRYAGNIIAVLESIPFADAENTERICRLLNQHCQADISNKTITKLVNKMKKWQDREAAEFGALQLSGTKEEKEVSNGDMNSLVSVIASRQQDRKAAYDQQIAQMIQKYGGGANNTNNKKKNKKHNKGRTKDDDNDDNIDDTVEPNISDADFASIQAKLLAGKDKKKKRIADDDDNDEGEDDGHSRPRVPIKAHLGGRSAIISTSPAKKKRNK